MVKIFSIVLIVLGVACFINVPMQFSTSIFIAFANLIAGIILIYAGNRLYKIDKQARQEGE